MFEILYAKIDRCRPLELATPLLEVYTMPGQKLVANTLCISQSVEEHNIIGDSYHKHHTIMVAHYVEVAPW